MNDLFRKKFGERFTAIVIGFVNKPGTPVYPYRLIVKPHPNWEGQPLKDVLSKQRFAVMNRKLIQVVYEDGQWQAADNATSPSTENIEFEPMKNKGYIPKQYNPQLGTSYTYQGLCGACGKTHSNHERK